LSFWQQNLLSSAHIIHKVIKNCDAGHSIIAYNTGMFTQSDGIPCQATAPSDLNLRHSPACRVQGPSIPAPAMPGLFCTIIRLMLKLYCKQKTRPDKVRAISTVDAMNLIGQRMWSSLTEGKSRATRCQLLFSSRYFRPLRTGEFVEFFLRHRLIHMCGWTLETRFRRITVFYGQRSAGSFLLGFRFGGHFGTSAIIARQCRGLTIGPEANGPILISG
jgi:hypothetical protein